MPCKILQMKNKWVRDECGQWWYHFGRKGKMVRTRGETRVCANERCARDFPAIRSHKTRFCSLKCKSAAMPLGWGKDHPAWKGGWKVNTRGYVVLIIGRQYILEHRLVMERELGRPLMPWETVHHINGKRDDNRIENLELRTSRHGPGVRATCSECGSVSISYEPLASVE